MAWTSITYIFKSVLTSAKMTQNQSNFEAVAQGLSGAPKILNAAFDDDAITKAKIAPGGTWPNAEIANLPTLGTNPASPRQTAILNSEIDAGAAIVDTKLATIATAGKVSDSALSAKVVLTDVINTFLTNQIIKGLTTAQTIFTLQNSAAAAKLRVDYSASTVAIGTDGGGALHLGAGGFSGNAAIPNPLILATNGDVTIGATLIGGKIPLLRIRTAADAAVFDSSDKMIAGTVPRGRFMASTDYYTAGTTNTTTITGISVTVGDLIFVNVLINAVAAGNSIFMAVLHSGAGGQSWQPQPRASLDTRLVTGDEEFTVTGVLRISTTGTLTLTSSVTSGTASVHNMGAKLFKGPL